MQVTTTAIPGVLILEPAVLVDRRGFLAESFNQRAFDAAIGGHVTFVQDNHSRSTRGVLRGLHYQRPPHAQGKLVRVCSGRVFDVAVDLRRSSPTFRRWIGIELSGENHRQVWLPAGMAHGYRVLSDAADVFYKTTDYHAPHAEQAIRWDDPTLAIAWPDRGTAPQLSARDAAAGGLEDACMFA